MLEIQRVMADSNHKKAHQLYTHIHNLGRLYKNPEREIYADVELVVDGENVTGVYLGEGGSKRAYSIGNGSVLLIPQRECCNYNIWNRITNEEVFMSDYYEELGLLNTRNKKVNIALKKEEQDELFSHNNTFNLPSYVSKSLIVSNLKVCSFKI